MLDNADGTRAETISQLITETVAGDLLLLSRMRGGGGFSELVAFIEVECSTPSAKQQLREWSRCCVKKKVW